MKAKVKVYDHDLKLRERLYVKDYEIEAGRLFLTYADGYREEWLWTRRSGGDSPRQTFHAVRAEEWRRGGDAANRWLLLRGSA